MKRRIAQAVAAASVVLVGAAVAVIVLRDDGTDTVTAGWTADAAQIYGREFAQFRSPVEGSEYGFDTTGVVEVGSTLVSLVGLPNPRTYMFDDAIMIGLDSATGDVRWRSPADGLGGCAGEARGGDIVCYSGLSDSEPALITFDAMTGDVTRHPTSFGDTAFGMTVSGGTVFLIEGNAEDNDVRVHAGSVDDIDELWVRPFDVGDAWEEVGKQSLQVMDGIGIVPMGSGSVVFDPADGRELWSAAYPQCFTPPELRDGVALVTASDCDSGAVTSVAAVTAAGSTTLAETGFAVSRDPWGRGSPVIIGTTAYDIDSGAELFTSALLARTIASTAEVVVASDETGNDPVVVGLDARTGAEKWRGADVENSGGVVELGGSTLLTVDFDSMVKAIDLGTGRTDWTAALAQTPDAGFTGAGFSEIITVGAGVLASSGGEMTMVPRPR